MWASHCCGAQALDVQAQRPWLTGPAAPRHVGSSRTGARTCVPCIGRWNLNHCATREALYNILDDKIIEREKRLVVVRHYGCQRVGEGRCYYVNTTRSVLEMIICSYILNNREEIKVKDKS